jgi:Penicillin-insensitive murein endopeptidase
MRSAPRTSRAQLRTLLTNRGSRAPTACGRGRPGDGRFSRSPLRRSAWSGFNGASPWRCVSLRHTSKMRRNARYLAQRGTASAPPATALGAATASLPRKVTRKIRPWFGHAAHFHVRLHCPASSPDCQEQKSPPLGDGCGAELASWLRHLPPPPPEDRVHPLPSLPVACHRVLMAK